MASYCPWLVQQRLMVARPLMVRHAGVCNTFRVRVCLSHRVFAGPDAPVRDCWDLSLCPAGFACVCMCASLLCLPGGAPTSQQGLLMTQTLSHRVQ